MPEFTVETDDEVLERHLWQTSDERKRFIGYLKIAPVVFLAVFVIYIAGAKVLYDRAVVNDNLHGSLEHYAVVLIAPVIALLLLGGAIQGTFSYRRSLKQTLNDRLRLGIDTKELRDQEEKLLKEPGTDFNTLWLITQNRIDYYHGIVTEQSKSSYKSGQIASGAGLAIIIIVAIIAAFTHNGTGAAAASVIGVAGAGLSAYISATFAKTQAAAAEQLNAFFLQPVEFFRALAAERLIEKVAEADRGRIVERIVQSMTPLSDIRAEPEK